MWILLYRVQHDEALKLAYRVFTYDEYPTSDRLELFRNEHFEDYLESKISEQFSDLATSLDYARRMLYFSYTKEKYSREEVILEISTYFEIYRKAWAGFNTLVDLAEKICCDFDTPISDTDITAETVP